MYHYYKQLIQEPTRVTTKTKSLIDHFFIVLAGVSKITISDHYLIYGARKFPSLKANARIIEFRDFKNINERAFLHDIRSLDALNLNQCVSVNEMWNIWKENFMNICDKHAPIKRRKIRNKSNPWITKQLLLEKRHKKYLKKKACKTGNLNDWVNYKHTRNNYNKLIKNTIKSHFSNDIQNNKGNLKQTWKSINQCLNRNPKSKKIVYLLKTPTTKILNLKIWLMHLTSILLMLVVTWRNNFLNLIFHLSITLIEWTKYLHFEKYPKKRYLHFC